MVSDNSTNSTHETRDADVGVVFNFGVGLVALIIFVLAATWFLYSFLGGAAPGEALGRPLAETPVTPPMRAPRLQPLPRLELEAIRAHEREILNGYGWIDRDAGIVRMPVERAMELWLERGVPVRASDLAEEARGSR